MNLRTITNDLITWGLTQKQLSDHIGVSQPTISRIINRDNHPVEYAVGLSLINLYKSEKRKQAKNSRNAQKNSKKKAK